MDYCKKCVYPSVAVNLRTDSAGVCSACRVAEQFAVVEIGDASILAVATGQPGVWLPLGEPQQFRARPAPAHALSRGL